MKGMDRKGVRRYFESRFTATCMADAYLKSYASLIERSQPKLRLIAAE